MTKDLLIENTKLDGFHEALPIQFHRTPEVEMLDEVEVETVTNHLRTENIRVKLGIVRNHGIRARTNEPHEIQKDFSEGASLTHRFFLCDAMNIDGTLTDVEVVGVDDRIEGVDEATTG